MTTIAKAVEDYLPSAALARSTNTARTYRQALAAFLGLLERHGVDATHLQAQKATEDWIRWFLDHLKVYAPATERLYLTAGAGWYDYLAAETLAEVNLPRLRMLIRRRARPPRPRLTH